MNDEMVDASLDRIGAARPGRADAEALAELLSASVFGEGGPYDHLALAVTTVDGDRLLADVGFGRHARLPLRLDVRSAGLISNTPCRPRVLSDFTVGCWYNRTSTDSHFTRSLTWSHLPGGVRHRAGPGTAYPMNTVSLPDGVRLPVVGLGVYQVPAADTERIVRTAIDYGYRAIDTATLYRNERGVGKAVRNCGLPREELFVTTKLWNDSHGYDNALRAFDTSRRELGLDYVDLYLIHWPVPEQDRYVETWRALEKLLADGLVRAIGVSNFAPEQLNRLFAETDTVPAVNQIELHPRRPQARARKFHAEHGIVTQAWRPLDRGGLLDHPVITGIAGRHDKTAAQVILRWHLQLGNVVIPKSVHPERIAANIDVFDFELTEADVTAITALGG